MREVDLATFARAHAAGAVVIDVREPMEYVMGHVPNARLLPMGQVAAAASDLPREVPVYVICATGNRSLTAADFLARAGVDAWSVGGGTAEWVHTGRPVVRGNAAVEGVR